VDTRFFCESCGNEVPFNAEVCPTCGKVFSAVKCPVCLYEGKPAEFTQGCPQCGYMSTEMQAPPGAGRGSGTGGNTSTGRGAGDRLEGKSPVDVRSGGPGVTPVRRASPPSRASRSRRSRRAVPAWLYVWGGFALLLTLVVLLILLFQRGL